MSCELTGKIVCTWEIEICRQPAAWDKKIKKKKKVSLPVQGAKTTTTKKRSRGPGGDLHGHPLPGPTEVQVCRRHWSRIFAFSPPLGGGIQVYHPARDGTVSSAAPLLSLSACTALLLLYGGYPVQYFFLGWYGGSFKK